MTVDINSVLAAADEFFAVADGVARIEPSHKADADPCWNGYEQRGMKTKDGREVPNCVPESKADASNKSVDELNRARAHAIKMHQKWEEKRTDPSQRRIAEASAKEWAAEAARLKTEIQKAESRSDAEPTIVRKGSVWIVRIDRDGSKSTFTIDADQYTRAEALEYASQIPQYTNEKFVVADASRDIDEEIRQLKDKIRTARTREEAKEHEHLLRELQSSRKDSPGGPINRRQADASSPACTFILVDGRTDQVIPHQGNWQAIVKREVADLKKMDVGRVTTKEYSDESVGYAKHDSNDKLSQHEREEIGREGSKHREDMPAKAFLKPSDRTYPVKVKSSDGIWEYDRKLLVAAARDARMVGHDDLAREADTIREREFGAKPDASDLAHDDSTGGHAKHSYEHLKRMVRGGAKLNDEQRALWNKYEAEEREKHNRRDSDSAFKSAPYSSMTTAALRAAAEEEKDRATKDKMDGELARRKKVAAGDRSVMTYGERLRHQRARGDADKDIAYTVEVGGRTMSSWPTKAQAEEKAAKMRKDYPERKVTVGSYNTRGDADETEAQYIRRTGSNSGYGQNYNRESVNKAILNERGKPMNGKEVRAIHSLLRGNGR